MGILEYISINEKEEENMQRNRKQSFMQEIMTLMLSQVLIKILGLIYKLYLTNKKGFGDASSILV